MDQAICRQVDQSVTIEFFEALHKTMMEKTFELRKDKPLLEEKGLNDR